MGMNVEENIVCSQKNGVWRACKVLRSREKSSGHENESTGVVFVVNDRWTVMRLLWNMSFSRFINGIYWPEVLVFELLAPRLLAHWAQSFHCTPSRKARRRIARRNSSQYPWKKRGEQLWQVFSHRLHKSVYSIMIVYCCWSCCIPSNLPPPIRKHVCLIMYCRYYRTASINILSTC